MVNKTYYYIIERSNLLDCDGSAFHDSLKIIERFDSLEKCKKKFKKILSDIDSEDIIDKHITSQHTSREKTFKRNNKKEENTAALLLAQ